MLGSKQSKQKFQKFETTKDQQTLYPEQVDSALAKVVALVFCGCAAVSQHALHAPAASRRPTRPPRGLLPACLACTNSAAGPALTLSWCGARCAAGCWCWSSAWPSCRTSG